MANERDNSITETPDAPPLAETRESWRSEGLRRERVIASKQHRDGLFHNTSGAKPGALLPGANPVAPRSTAPDADGGAANNDLEQGVDADATSKQQRMGMGGMLREWMFGGQQRRPPIELPIERPHDAWVRANSDTGQRVTWLGHSTVLLELDGKRVLTDPVFGNRVGPTSFIGPRRFHRVPAELAEIPALDVVLLSHDHFDHLCAPTMRALAKMSVPIVTALGVGAHLERYGIAPQRITELDWFESAVVGGVRFTATPSQHFSGRAIGGRNKTLWASWVIESERRKVFFSGDTGLTNEFVDIGRKYGPFDLVMLEIGAFHPAWGAIHLGPANALEAFRMLGGGTLLPVHWGTFSLGFHAWNEPGEQLLELAPKYGARILTPRLGQVFEPEHVDGPIAWWRDLVPAHEREVLSAANAR